MKNTEKTMDKIVALCKNRGFIFAGSRCCRVIKSDNCSAEAKHCSLK